MQGPPFSVLPDEIKMLYADNYTINVLKTFNALAENQNFVKRGVSQLNETVYHLVPKS
jgi:thiopurine S-methyltransferase